MKYYVVLWFSQ